MASAIRRFVVHLTRTRSFYGGIANHGSKTLYEKHNTSREFHLQCALQGTVKLEMPALSPTMTEGTIVKWYKKEGDRVAPGDMLCDIQTDKAVVSMDTEEEGILAKIVMPENSKDVKIGTLIALMVEEGDDWQNVEVPDLASSSSSESSSSESSTSSSEAESSTAASSVSGGKIRMSPAARKLLEEYSVKNPRQVTATGPRGMINKEDVLKFVSTQNLAKVDLSAKPASPPPQPAQPTPTPPKPVTTPPPTPAALTEAPYEDIATTNMRKTIAKRLTESKTTIPHAYVSIDCNMDSVTSLRKQLVANGVKCSVNDFIIKAAGISLQRVPKVNSLWQGDRLEMTSAVDISVAVATDQGLITPIVKSAAHLGVDEISKSVKDLATKAREGKLQLHEFQGGSFTISNLGMFGISEFSAVINPPQTAIMAVGGSRLVVSEEGKPLTNMTVTLSYDSRALDETEASLFLEVFKSTMENPSTMTIGLRVSNDRESMFS